MVFVRIWRLCVRQLCEFGDGFPFPPGPFLRRQESILYRAASPRLLGGECGDNLAGKIVGDGDFRAYLAGGNCWRLWLLSAAKLLFYNCQFECYNLPKIVYNLNFANSAENNHEQILQLSCRFGINRRRFGDNSRLRLWGVSVFFY